MSGGYLPILGPVIREERERERERERNTCKRWNIKQSSTTNP